LLRFDIQREHAKQGLLLLFDFTIALGTTASLDLQTGVGGGYDLKQSTHESTFVTLMLNQNVSKLRLSAKHSGVMNASIRQDEGCEIPSSFS